MSKKRDNNKRKKQLKARGTRRPENNRQATSSVLAKLGFEITDEPMEDEDFYYVMIGEYQEAKKCLSVLHAVSPHHAYTVRLNNKINGENTFIA